MTQRIAEAETPKVDAIAGNAMLTIESSEITNTPAAPTQRLTRVYYGQHRARRPRLVDPRRRSADRLRRRRRRGFRRRRDPATADCLHAGHSRHRARADRHDAPRQPLAHLVEPRRDRPRGDVAASPWCSA